MGTRMVVKWSRDCEKACFTYHCPEAHWCDTGVGQSTSGGLARRWRHAARKKSPGICRSDARQRASGSESAALQSLRNFDTLLDYMWLLFRKQPRTGKDRGSGRRFDLRNPSDRENGTNLRRDCRAALPLPLALCLTSLRQIPGDFLPTASPPSRPHTAGPGPGHAVPGNVRWNFVPEKKHSERLF